MRTALLQMCASDQPEENARTVVAALETAKADGAGFVVTPEVTNCVSASRTHQSAVLRPEAEDLTLAKTRETAARLGLWVCLGSLALKSDPPETRFTNRSFLIAPDGSIVARYDKMHMFDVQVTETETYRESAGYAPGSQAVIVKTPFATLGLTICYDLRFPYLYRHLAQSGAEVLLVPSAFSPATGPHHWQPLLQARAIETGCWVLAPAQTGDHSASRGRARRTYGHSLAVDPWGKVVVDADVAPGLSFVDLSRDAVTFARKKVPSLQHDRQFTGSDE